MNFVNYERLYHPYREVLLFRFGSVVVIQAIVCVKVLRSKWFYASACTIGSVTIGRACHLLILNENSLSNWPWTVFLSVLLNDDSCSERAVCNSSYSMTQLWSRRLQGFPPAHVVAAFFTFSTSPEPTTVETFITSQIKFLAAITFERKFDMPEVL